MVFVTIGFLFVNNLNANESVNRKQVLEVGKMLPNATLSQYQKPDIRLDDLKGFVKILSIVPQLNTPVCDEQTHRFSETNGGLDQHVKIITISTNSAVGQFRFAQKAKIKNILFLSDRPQFDFGRQTGLLNSDFGFLRRTVMVVDEDNVIQYVDFVPGGGLPQIKKALKAAKRIIEKNS